MSRIEHRVHQAGVYFVTTDTWQRRQLFKNSNVAQIVLEQILQCREKGFYKLHAFVIMPDHLHLLLTPGDDTTLEKAMQMIKGGSAFRIRKDLSYQFPIWHSGFMIVGCEMKMSTGEGCSTSCKTRSQLDWPLNPRNILGVQRAASGKWMRWNEVRDTSGAKAQVGSSLMSRLKPRPTNLFRTPCFQVKLDGLGQIGSSTLDIFTLGSDIQLGATGHVPSVFPGDERGEAVVHKPIVAKLGRAHNSLKIKVFAITSHE